MSDKSAQGKDYKYSIEDRPVNGPILPPSEKIYTEEEKEQMLLGYFEVPKEKWKDIAPGSQIRYVNAAGKFFAGGFIKVNSIEATNRLIMSHYNATNNTFYVDMSNMAQVYKKYYKLSHIEIEMLVASVKILSNHIKKHEERIRELERQLNKR